jgi:hypothetical protein
MSDLSAHPVERASLERLRVRSTRGPAHVAVNLTSGSHFVCEVRLDRLTAIHLRCQTRSGPVRDKKPLDGSTGREPGPKGLASLDQRSRSKSIGHKPYIAYLDVEPLLMFRNPKAAL